MNIQPEFIQETKKMRIAALTNTLNIALQYGEEGLKLGIQILNNEKGHFRLIAYDLLWQKLDSQGREKLREYLRELP